MPATKQLDGSEARLLLVEKIVTGQVPESTIRLMLDVAQGDAHIVRNIDAKLKLLAKNVVIHDCGEVPMTSLFLGSYFTESAHRFHDLGHTQSWFQGGSSVSYKFMPNMTALDVLADHIGEKSLTPHEAVSHLQSKRYAFCPGQISDILSNEDRCRVFGFARDGGYNLLFMQYSDNFYIVYASTIGKQWNVTYESLDSRREIVLARVVAFRNQ